MPEFVSVVSFPMKEGFKDAPEWKDNEGTLNSATGLLHSFRGTGLDEPNRLELATSRSPPPPFPQSAPFPLPCSHIPPSLVWATDEDHEVVKNAESAKKIFAALESYTDNSKTGEAGAKFAGTIICPDGQPFLFSQVAASPVVHIGSYRVPASVSKADFEAAWAALCKKVGPPAGATAGPVHGWAKDPAPDGSGDQVFVVTGGWEDRGKYDAVAKDPEHPAALPLLGLATKASGKFAVFEKLK